MACSTALCVAGVTSSRRPTKTRTVCAGAGVIVSGRTRVHELTRHDVEQATAFFEPGIAPRFKHGLRFVLIEALRDEHVFDGLL